MSLFSFLRKKGPPSASDVAIRALCLRQVSVYGIVSPPRELLANWTKEDLAKFHEESLEKRDAHWSALGSLRKHLSPKEKEFAETTMATMNDRQQTDAVWRAEAFQVLLWALGHVRELPHYDTPIDNDLLKGRQAGSLETFLSEAKLRSADEIQEARGRAELWQWRSRTRQLIEDGRSFPQTPKLAQSGIRTFDDIVRFTATRAASDGTIPQSIDEDFPAMNKAYRDLDPEEWSQIRSITMERHYALNWLCGHAPSNRWDETPTDT